jgi:hypothetical protein
LGCALRVEGFSFTIRHLLFAIRCSPFTSRQSPFAAISRLADLPISRFADKFGSAEASLSQLVHRLKSVSTKNEACYLGCALRVES